MFDGRWRSAVDERTEPIGAWLQGHGITADVLTATGLVSAMLTAGAVATGHLLAAVFLLTLTGAHDLFDGPVAKAAGTSSVRGAFFDSVTDRVADALLMGGVAWYLLSKNEGHLVLLPFAILAVTSLVSYQRAKAEALGLAARGGLMERAERMILLGLGFLLSWLLVPILWVLLVLTTFTAVGRFLKVWKLASEASPQAIQRRRAMVVESRFKEWRARTTAERGSTHGVAEKPRWKTFRGETPGTRTSGLTRRGRRAGYDRHSSPRG